MHAVHYCNIAVNKQVTHARIYCQLLKQGDKKMLGTVSCGDACRLAASPQRLLKMTVMNMLNTDCIYTSTDPLIQH